MIELKIEDEVLKSLKIFFGKESGKINKLINKALSKATTYVRSQIKTRVKDDYEIYDKLVNDGLKTSKKGNEKSILAYTKRNAMSDFYVSLMTPGRSESKLLASVKKKNGTKEMKTLFWAYYKSNTSKLGLFIRNRERNHITKVKSPSMFQMSVKEVDEKIMNKANQIFNETLKKLMEKEIQNV